MSTIVIIQMGPTHAPAELAMLSMLMGVAVMVCMHVLFPRGYLNLFNVP